MPALPFCRIRLAAPNPLSTAYPRQTKTLGGHVRRKLGLPQRQVMEEIGVTAETISNWESYRTQPVVHFAPGIIRFLGYEPNVE